MRLALRIFALVAILACVASLQAQYTYSCPTGKLPVCNNSNGAGCNGTVPQFDCVTDPNYVPNEWASGGVKTAGAAMAGNSTQLWSFQLPSAITTSKISFTPSTADATANKYDIGIYSADGQTLLCHIGAT